MPEDRFTTQMAASLERLRRVSDDRPADREGRQVASPPEDALPRERAAVKRRNDALDRRAEAADRRDETQAQREADLDDRQTALDRRAQLLESKEHKD